MIPQQIKDVLSKLHAGGFPSAIVAGGAIRDYIFGKPIKDIDVFVSWDDWFTLAQYCGVSFTKILDRDSAIEAWSLYLEIPDVYCVYGVTPVDGELPVQIIVMKPGLTPVQRVDQLDFGFCQAYYDGGRKGIGITNHFAEDAQKKSITLVHCENQNGFYRSMIRYERLMQKYQEFQLVIPQKYQQYHDYWLSEASLRKECHRAVLLPYGL